MKKHITRSKNLSAKNIGRPDLPYKTVLDRANDAMEAILPTLELYSLPFDSRLSRASPNDCVTSLVCSRVLKKFVPKSGNDTDLKAVAMMAFLKYEEELTERMQEYRFASDPLFSKVRRRLLSMCSGFTLDYSDWDLDVGPGETYLPSGGYTSLLAKLSDIDHWTTTADCWQDTCMLIYTNRSIKRIAKQHIGIVPKQRRNELYAAHRGHPAAGFMVFSDLLKSVITVVPGSRGSTVPKNNETDRFINVEPFFPMLLQRCLAASLLRCLKSAGYPLDGQVGRVKTHIGDRQEIHKRMIACSSYATIDFSNASDSVCLNVIRSLFPQKIVSVLEVFRSNTCKINDTDVELFKLSSMGNGFTFEVMTLLLLACARCFTDDCSVFGDDVIIPNRYAKDFLLLVEKLGFRANNKKTFIDSAFRESCGSFYHDDIGYLTSFDFRRCEVYNDVIIMHNKLSIILREHSDRLHFIVGNRLAQLQQKLSELGPLSRKGPFPGEKDAQMMYLGSYFFAENARRRHMSASTSKVLHKKWYDRLRPMFDRLQLDPLDVGVLVTSLDKPSRSTRQRSELATNLVRLKTLRPVIETVRGDFKAKEFLCLVEYSTGRLFRIAQLLLDQRSWAGSLDPKSFQSGNKNEHVNAYRSYLRKRRSESGVD